MPTRIREYNRKKAIDYAHQWAFGRNPRYLNFDSYGGDCTNFASQCIFAGSDMMNYKPVFGWYYNSGADRAPSWSGVQFLYNFLVKNSGVGPFAKDVPMREARPGDIVQISFDGRHFAHSPVVVSIGPNPNPDNILVVAHTFDADNRPLSSYTYEKLRFIHIEGVRTT